MGHTVRSFVPLLPVSPDTLVPPNHCYRHLERSLDVSVARDVVRDTYAETGRPPIDLAVFFELQIVLFSKGLRPERQLLQVVADRLSLRWYLGDDLADRLPDHFVLTRVRQRCGPDLFRPFRRDGQVLRFPSHCRTSQRRMYATSAACATCAPRTHGTTSKRGRRIGQHLDEEY